MTMKNQIRVLLIVSSVALLAPAGCVFETGVGDPKKSTVDRKLTGYWKNDTELVTVVELDESTCLVDWMSFEGTGTTLQPAHRVINRGWLTSIDAAEYLTLEMLVPKSQQRKKYAVMKLRAVLSTDSIFRHLRVRSKTSLARHTLTRGGWVALLNQGHVTDSL